MALAATNAPAQTAAPSWILPDLIEGAKAEGALNVYSSVNEQEGLPLWQAFEKETGVKVNYTRANDAALTSKIQIEARSGQQGWDILVTTSVTRLPPALRAQFDVPESAAIPTQMRDADRRWYGIYANYNAPAYNTNLVNLDRPPADFEAFLTHTEWIGKVGIDALEFPWTKSIIDHYGEEKGGKLLTQFFTQFKPTPIDGHLALARAVAAGEYAVTVNNYVNLVNNLKMTGAPTDYWGQTPATILLGQMALNPKAPHSQAARLAANFLLSKEGQTAVSRFGRLPLRKDVTPTPPNALSKMGDAEILTLDFSPEEEKLWQKRYQDYLRGR